MSSELQFFLKEWGLTERGEGKKQQFSEDGRGL
jgi:hypothetical protein